MTALEAAKIALLKASNHTDMTHEATCRGLLRCAQESGQDCSAGQSWPLMLQQAQHTAKEEEGGRGVYTARSSCFQK